jgi:hypothetical protein
MMSKTGWRKLALFMLVSVVTGIVLLVLLYMRYIGFDNLKTVYALHTSGKSIVAMNEQGRYLTKRQHATERLLDIMQQAGWTYTKQEGSGYFFTKDDEQASVTTQIWRRDYIVYSNLPMQLSFID